MPQSVYALECGARPSRYVQFEAEAFEPRHVDSADRTQGSFDDAMITAGREQGTAFLDNAGVTPGPEHGLAAKRVSQLVCVTLDGGIPLGSGGERIERRTQPVALENQLHGWEHGLGAVHRDLRRPPFVAQGQEQTDEQ